LQMQKKGSSMPFPAFPEEKLVQVAKLETALCSQWRDRAGFSPCFPIKPLRASDTEFSVLQSELMHSTLHSFFSEFVAHTLCTWLQVLL